MRYERLATRVHFGNLFYLYSVNTGMTLGIFYSTWNAEEGSLLTLDVKLSLGNMQSPTKIKSKSSYYMLTMKSYAFRPEGLFHCAPSHFHEGVHHATESSSNRRGLQLPEK